MRHDYYYYSREELLKAPKLPIEILSDNQAVFQAIAQEMADEIKRKNALGERTVNTKSKQKREANQNEEESIKKQKNN